MIEQFLQNNESPIVRAAYTHLQELIKETLEGEDSDEDSDDEDCGECQACQAQAQSQAQTKPRLLPDGSMDPLAVIEIDPL